MIVGEMKCFRLLAPRVTCCSSLRFKSKENNLVEELNKIKSKDLLKILSQEQAESFLQLRRSSGGKFHSLDQFRKELKFSLDFDKFFDHLLSAKAQDKDKQRRIQVEPRLSPKFAAEIESVCSLDYTLSHINWAIVKTTNEKNRFQVQQWNSLELDADRKFNFLKTFHQLSDGLSTIPLNDADVLLVEQATYRYQNVKVATYLSQIQQSRAVFNTLLHCRTEPRRSIYHVSSRDVALRYGLLIERTEMTSLEIDHQLKTFYHRMMKRQKEPMAQCLLRALAFLECVNGNKEFS